MRELKSLTNLRPHCVDLDGTLIKTNTLLEAAMALIRTTPWAAIFLPFWLMRGQAYLWQRLSERTFINPALLPYREEVLEYLEREKRTGRELVLISGSNQAMVEKVAHHLGLFHRFFGSTETVHLVGPAKLAVLLELYGRKAFDYLGDSNQDFSIWRESQRAIIVSRNRSLIKRVRQNVEDLEQIQPSGRPWLKAVIKAMRPYQWSKNLLLLAPIFLAHKITNLPLMLTAVQAIIAFSLCASAVYIMNDLLDLESDRLHPRKRKRPFAAGDLSVLQGGLLSMVLLISAFAIALALSPEFAAVLLAYFVMTVGYSSYLKQKLLIDVFVLASLYTIRVWAGSVCTGIVISNWALAFFMSLSLSLALAKRYSELAASIATAAGEQQVTLRRRNYQTSDIPFLLCLGCVTAMTSVLVIALYISSQDVIHYYSSPASLWFICPAFAYWVSRLWLITTRGKLNEDPVLFAIKDKVSYLLGTIIVATVVIAT
ncbi:MAG TPA: UbiA family prenyltransferase [Blastocatellia bacterium]|nr:UbiA family prenyltransferase [Blastocatellia bacterium]